MVIAGRDFHYTTVWQWSQILSVIIWSVLGLSHIWWAFVYYYWFTNSIIDQVSFGFNAALFSQNILVFIYVLFNLDKVGARRLYWRSTLLTALGPWLVWPITLIGNIVHAVLFKDTLQSYWDFELDGTYVGIWYSYIVVKNLLFFLYNLIIVFISFETFFPIYEWYYTLAGLAVKAPYKRPTPEEVAANDVLTLTRDFPFDI